MQNKIKTHTNNNNNYWQKPNFGNCADCDTQLTLAYDEYDHSWRTRQYKWAPYCKTCRPKHFIQVRLQSDLSKKYGITNFRRVEHLKKYYNIEQLEHEILQLKRYQGKYKSLAEIDQVIDNERNRLINERSEQLDAMLDDEVVNLIKSKQHKLNKYYQEFVEGNSERFQYAADYITGLYWLFATDIYRQLTEFDISKIYKEEHYVRHITKITLEQGTSREQIPIYCLNIYEKGRHNPAENDGTEVVACAI